MWYPDNQLVQTTGSKQRRPLQESNKNTKYVLTILTITYTVKTAEIKLLKF